MGAEAQAADGQVIVFGLYLGGASIRGVLETDVGPLGWWICLRLFLRARLSRSTKAFFPTWFNAKSNISILADYFPFMGNELFLAALHR